MKRFFLLPIIFCCFGTTPQANAQADAPETLRWVESQARKIDTLLESAIISHEHVNLILRLTDAYLLFDAVSLAGLYCPEVRESAHQGLNLTDVVNYRLEKDLNAAVVRATLARAQAEKMRLAAQRCGTVTAQTPDISGKTFSPAEVLAEEAHQVELLLSDGLAVRDFHILSQKLEHAIRLLHEVEHIASSFDDCREPAGAAARAIIACETALGAPNWMEVNRQVNTALQELKGIVAANCR